MTIKNVHTNCIGYLVQITSHTKNTLATFGNITTHKEKIQQQMLTKLGHRRHFVHSGVFANKTKKIKSKMIIPSVLIEILLLFTKSGAICLNVIQLYFTI